MNSCLTIVLVTLTLSMLAANLTAASSGKPEVRTFVGTEGDTTCIVMEAAIVIRIPYTNEAGNSSIGNITVTDADTTSGKCHKTDTAQSIAIHFGSSQNSLSFEFERDGKGQNPGYKLKTLAIGYEAGGSLFPDASPFWVGYHSASIESPDFARVSPDQGYYLCNKSSGFELGFTATVELDSWRFKAFITGNNEEFQGDPSMCGGGGVNIIVIIVSVIVGIVIVDLIVVGVVYVIRRRRPRGGHEAMN